MMFWFGGHWAFWQAALMWAGMIAFWGLIIWGVYLLVTSATRRPGRGDQGGGAQSILDERLARGEISPEEYQRLRELIDRGRDRATASSGSAS